MKLFYTLFKNKFYYFFQILFFENLLASQSVIVAKKVDHGLTLAWSGGALPVDSALVLTTDVQVGSSVGAVTVSVSSSNVRQELVLNSRVNTVKVLCRPASKNFVARNFSTSSVRFKYPINKANLTPKLDCDKYEQNISGLLTVDLINWFVNKFWDEIMTNLSDNSYVIFLFKVEYQDGKFLTFDQVHRATSRDKNLVLENLETVFKKKDNNLYKVSPLRRLICQY